MTIDEAKEEVPTIDRFEKWACIHCNNDWFCPSNCALLDKAELMDYDRILEAFARYDGDPKKVARFIKRNAI